MNILIDLLPTKVTIDSIEYDINSDFRTSILFEMLMQDDELSNEDKILRALELYYLVLPINLNEAVEKMLWFYRCGKDIERSNGVGEGNSSKQVYSFDYDDDYIYSAFLDQYGVDLQDIDDLHWWKFKSMFKSLKEDNEIVKVMGYRAITISNEMSKEEKAFYRKMKKLHEIPKSKNEKQKINDITEALMNDGDLSKVL